MVMQTLARRISNVGNEVHRLLQDVTALQSVSVSDNPNNIHSFSYQAALRAESITQSLRHLVYDAANDTKKDYLVDAAQIQGISVCENNGIVKIQLPCLIPKRSKRGSAFIADPLSTVLRKFVHDHQPSCLPFLHCVISITHVYDKTLPIKGRVRDHDNIELKGIMDVINMYLLTDDVGTLCDIYSTSKTGSADMTRITIMEQDMFPEWILRHKNSP